MDAEDDLPFADDDAVVSIVPGRVEASPRASSIPVAPAIVQTAVTAPVAPAVVATAVAPPAPAPSSAPKFRPKLLSRPIVERDRRPSQGSSTTPNDANG